MGWRNPHDWDSPFGLLEVLEDIGVKTAVSSQNQL
jgi:hypothetical protein